MPVKLGHLPTKPTMVKPEEGRPFVRKQHYQPNKPVGQDRPLTVHEGGGEDKPEKGEKPTLRLVKKPESQAGSTGQPLSPTEPSRNANSSPIEPQSAELHYAEDQMAQNLPSEIFGHNDFQTVGKNTSNAVYNFKSDNGEYEFYWKPRQGEDSGWKKHLQNSELAQKLLGVNPTLRDFIPDNYGGREVASYETAKMLGVEDLVPPTMNQEHQIGAGSAGLWDGPAQMSAQDYGQKILGYDNMQLAPELDQDGLRKIFDEAKNGTDMVAYDFAIGNTDRNPGNFFSGTDQRGDKKLMAIDNGLSHPEHAGDIITPDWQPTLNTQHEYFKSEGAKRKISSNMVEGIMRFDEGQYHTMAKSNGIPEKARQGTVDRVKMMRDKISEKYVEAIDKFGDREWGSMEERRAVLKSEAALTGEDLAKIIETEMVDKGQRSNGEKKYTKETFGSGFQSERDWKDQIRYGIGKEMF